MNENDWNATEMRQEAIQMLNKLEPYYILVLATVGILGNTISFGIFLSSKFNKKESNLILASLSLVDNVFLVKLILVNLSHFGLDLFNRNTYVCKLTVFVAFVCGFLSVWYVTLFSIERLIAVMFPLHRFLICNRKRNQLSILVLFMFATVFYSFALVTSGVEYEYSHSTQTRCVTYEKYFKLVKTLSTVDTVLSILVPFVIILFVNISISIKLSRSSVASRRNTKRLSSWSSFRKNTFCSNRSSMSSSEDNRCEPTVLPRTRRQSSKVVSFNVSHRGRNISYSRTTRMLIIISITFFILNSLMAYSRLRHLFESRSGLVSSSESLNDELLERVSCYLYYLNFSINFFLYVVNKSTFRDILFGVFKRHRSVMSQV